MPTPGDDTPGPADGDGAAATSGLTRRGRRALLGLVAVAAVLGVVVVLVAQGPDDTDPLGADSPHLANFTMHTKGRCRYEPDRGGMVAHFDVSTRDAGRFTVDLEAVTDEGADNLDISTDHAVRVTVPFYGGRARRQFDVVVPLTEADHRAGYRKCRYVVNPTGAE